MALTADESLLSLVELVSGTSTYQDRLRWTNSKEFKLDKLLPQPNFTFDSILTKKKELAFVRDTTLDPK